VKPGDKMNPEVSLGFCSLNKYTNDSKVYQAAKNNIKQIKKM